MSVIAIDSNSELKDVEISFKISAGPGAGKTYWLINHIRNILHKSNKLFSTRKVACITFTNNAAENIINRLGACEGQVEIATIHSFLYRNIVKPYASFIAKEYDLNIEYMDGHVAINISFERIRKWCDSSSQSYLYIGKDAVDTKKRQLKIKEALENLRWILEDNKLQLKINPQKSYLGRITNGLSIRNDSLLFFKKMFWSQGVLHHDDVLFFSFQILQRFPYVATILVAKFPYLFIDEFQDSNMIQIEICKLLARTGCIVGVIGDIAQSIYSFQGADCNQFKDFLLPSMQEYILAENRRSTNEIIALLNTIRTDFKQVSQRGVSMEKPTLYVGNLALALEDAKNRCGTDQMVTLTRDNITSNAVKANILEVDLDSKLLEKLKQVDSNFLRCSFIYSSIYAVAYAKQSKFKDAIKILEKVITEDDKIIKRLKALEIIQTLQAHYELYKNGSLKEYSEFIRERVNPTLSKVTGGAIKTFYDTNPFSHLYLCVSVPEDNNFYKTIHKAKGEEYKNVFLILKREEDLEFIINPDLFSNTEKSEEHRINYVGVSRAKNQLFISIPILVNNHSILQSHFDLKNT
jgi:DNA helicase-2/ATP-dependent DNA helicase PcrA